MHTIIIQLLVAAAISWSGNTPIAYEKAELKLEIVYQGDCKPCQETVYQQSMQNLLMPQSDSTGLRIIMAVDSIN